MLANIAAATARHDALSAGRFRSELARLSTPAMLAAVKADRARLLANVTAAGSNHDWRMVAAFRTVLEGYAT
jgi:hypothetical protein